VIALADVSPQSRRAAQCHVVKRLLHVGTLGPTLQERGAILPHDLAEAQRLAVGHCGGGRRSSGLTTCWTPARLTCVYSAVVPIR
jgi:hypothetical protein